MQLEHKDHDQPKKTQNMHLKLHDYKTNNTHKKLGVVKH